MITGETTAPALSERDVKRGVGVYRRNVGEVKMFAILEPVFDGEPTRCAWLVSTEEITNEQHDELVREVERNLSVNCRATRKEHPAFSTGGWGRKTTWVLSSSEFASFCDWLDLLNPALDHG